MPRARNIKPGFFKNPDLADLEIATRLLFIGLWCLADREGRLEDKPKHIGIELFPRDRLDFDAMLQELADSGHLIRYEVEGVRYIQIVAFSKHQSPHGEEQNSVIPPPPGFTPPPKKAKPEPRPKRAKSPVQTPGMPEASPVDTQGMPEAPTVETAPGFPDSLIPGSPVNPQHQPLAPTPGGEGPAAEVVEFPRKRESKPAARAETPTAATWAAYARAYERRYGAPPVRNAVVNGKLSNLIARLGAEEAPHVAAFFIGHNGAQYTRGGHDVGLLLRDCEALRTQWATGQRMTEARARQMDRTQATGDAFAALLEEAERNESTTHP